MKVIAKKPFEYQGRMLAVDDEVDVPPALGRAWKMMRRADIKAEDAGETPDEVPQKRRYRRRDMRVED